MNHDLGNDVFIPQLFTAVPALNGAASFLTCSNNFITSCFSDYSCKLVLLDLMLLLIERARRTVHGSADDIGWMQRASRMPSVEDGTERFMEILDNIGHCLHNLSNSMVYLLVPGLFSNHGPLYFVNTKVSFYKMGLACFRGEKCQRDKRVYRGNLLWFKTSNEHVMLLGHSKGGIDAAAALSLCCSDLKDKVAGLVLAQSPYGVPGSILVRPKRKLDHAWMVSSSLNDDPSEADASRVC
ncbi:hypothetical protein P3X46_003862 [Hevea brasiliensis]|uniref:Fungal lipase-like domain-containing protein n=1 Tax=Hevea brasiliensis TaxID=3981 RepID=A0ABQ9N7K8_HEVBR|nr:hypothetical protein P3X46_003862 [Hevea brasiliensis]